MEKFTRRWLKEHYIDKKMSAREIALMTNCSQDTVYRYVKLWGLKKKDGCNKWSGKTSFVPANKGKKMPDCLRRIRRSRMPHRKPVEMINAKGKTLKRFDSINEAANETGIHRENIRQVLQGKRSRAGGYVWRYSRTYGEELRYRLDNLDFSLPLEKMVKQALKGLPRRMPKEKAIEYYNRKLRACWLGVAT